MYLINNRCVCNSFSDGEITNNISGGNGGPYNIVDWGGIIDPTSIPSGTYSITVADASTITASNPLACENDTVITINEPDYFSVDFTSSSSEICFNDPVSLDFNFNQGGVAPYTVNYTVNATPQVAGPINSSGINNISISPQVGNNTFIITNILMQMDA